MIADPREHPVFAGFELPRATHCTKPNADYSHGLVIRNMKTALSRSHLRVNPPWIWNFLIFDVDDADGERRWHDRGLPMPRWNAINRANGHSQPAWAMAAPVLLGNDHREAPLRFACAIEGAMREQIGGDPCYNGIICKNPLHPSHRVLWGDVSYTLDQIAAYLPGLDRHKPKPHVPPESVGIGRNVHTYEYLRRYAYRAIREHWDGTLEAWMAHLGNVAANFTGNEHPEPLDRTETRHIGRSVGKWTWARMTPETWAAKQARRGKIGGLASGKARRAGNAERDAEIVRLATVGKATQRAIADRYGLTQQAVSLIVKRNTSEALYGAIHDGNTSEALCGVIHDGKPAARPSAKRRKRLPPGELPETADMLPVEPWQPVAETADSAPVEPSAEDARRENARQWIANLLPDRKPSARKWKRKKPKPVAAVQDAEQSPWDAWCSGCSAECRDAPAVVPVTDGDREMLNLGYVPCRDPLATYIPF